MWTEIIMWACIAAPLSVLLVFALSALLLRSKEKTDSGDEDWWRAIK